MPCVRGLTVAVGGLAWADPVSMMVRGETVPGHAYLANGWTPVADVAVLAEELGCTWWATADATISIAEARGRCPRVSVQYPAKAHWER